MSWYVQFLVTNADNIRNEPSDVDKVYQDGEEGEFMPIISEYYNTPRLIPGFYEATTLDLYERIDILTVPNYEDDVYNDLLILEKKIKEMKDARLLESKDIKILLGISKGFSFDDVGQKVGMDRKSIRLRFRRICDTVAFYIGGIYTDDGFVEYAREKYNLKQEQVEKLSKIIEENRRI